MDTEIGRNGANNGQGEPVVVMNVVGRKRLDSFGMFGMFGTSDVGCRIDEVNQLT
jgi:hypothetical protein